MGRSLCERSENSGVLREITQGALKSQKKKQKRLQWGTSTDTLDGNDHARRWNDQNKALAGVEVRAKGGSVAVFVRGDVKSKRTPSRFGLAGGISRGREKTTHLHF